MKKKSRMPVDSILGGIVVGAVAVALVVYILFFYEKKEDANSPVGMSVSEQVEVNENVEAKASVAPNRDDASENSKGQSEEPKIKSEEPAEESEKPVEKSEKPAEKSEKPTKESEIQSEVPVSNNQQGAEPTEKVTSLDEIMRAQQNVEGKTDLQTSVNASNYAAQVLELVNAQRRGAGLVELAYDPGVAVAAQKRAGELVSVFSHNRPDGQNCFTALDEQGCVYQGAGENIAMGQKTPQDVMNSWMGSEGHRANILNGTFSRVGIGCYQDKMGQMYWVQLFTY